jgi:hypothetical protein
VITRKRNTLDRLNKASKQTNKQTKVNQSMQLNGTQCNQTFMVGMEKSRRIGDGGLTDEEITPINGRASAKRSPPLA